MTIQLIIDLLLQLLENIFVIGAVSLGTDNGILSFYEIDNYKNGSITDNFLIFMEMNLGIA
jgi:hypothetical protein